MSEATKTAKQEAPADALSASVKGVAARLTGDVSAWAIVRELLRTHAYGGMQRGALRLGPGPPDVDRRPVVAWLEDVAELFDLTDGAFLDGRRVVLGLALLDRRLFRELSEGGFLRALERELEEAGGLQLSKEGTRLLGLRRRAGEIVPTLDDAPADSDELGREILAEVLARRIRRIRLQGPVWVSEWSSFSARVRHYLNREAEGQLPEGGWRGRRRAFMVHVEGPWGSGKTSLLNFLARELRGSPSAAPETRWVVVNFNAWSHQRIVPPWWWLMTALHRAGIRELWEINRRRAISLWLWDVWWRLRDGWAAYLVLPVAAVVGFLLWRRGFFGENLSGAEDTLKSIAAITAFTAGIWGGIKGLNRWLLSGSAGAAAALLARTRDPMYLVRRRFARLVHWIRQPVVIFVDDLDRCQAKFVVELLEGIQTLFVEQPVVYVIAADGSWLRDCYAQVYKDFCTQASEPGRPLGSLFLEKTFQESVRVPRIPQGIRETYWKHLLSERKAAADEGENEHRAAAEELFEQFGTPGEILDALSDAEKAEQISPHELRRAAALQLESRAVEESTRHTLDDFSSLLEDNPRAMKKLVNAYGIQRHMQVLEGRNLHGDERQLRQLALWTILTLRWPLLAEYLSDHPGEIVIVGKTGRREAKDDLTTELERLFRDEAVRQVVEGRGVKPPVTLDAEAIQGFLGLEAETGPPTGNGARRRRRTPARPKT
jgi:hypothetical protein